MAVKLSMAKGNIDVVLSVDDAVTCPPEEYQAYLESFKKGSGDESLLKLNGEPTRFVMRKVLPFEADIEITDMQMEIGEGGKPKIKTGFVLEEVRKALIDIKNPPDAPSPIEFKRDADNYANKEIIQMLYQAGVLAELWNARNNAKGGPTDRLKKK